MRNVVLLVLGMVLLVLGAQGGIRLLVDHDNGGILEWLPGGFAAQLGGFAAMTLVGIIVAARSGAKVRRADAGQ